jgi:hypothetical protein
MEIKKTSEDNFTLQKEGNEYVLYMGSITPKTPRPFTIEISDVLDSSKVSVQSTCGCSTAEKTIKDNNTLTAKISYNSCDSIFNKTIVISNNGRNTNLKIKGACQQTL